MPKYQENQIDIFISNCIIGNRNRRYRVSGCLVKWNTLREFFSWNKKQHPSGAMPADAFCRQIDFAGKSKPLTRQRFLIPCTGAYLAYLPQSELHSDRFVGTFTPFRIKSTPFRNGHLNSLFFFFYFTAFSRKIHELFLSI